MIIRKTPETCRYLVLWHNRIVKSSQGRSFTFHTEFLFHQFSIFLLFKGERNYLKLIPYIIQTYFSHKTTLNHPSLGSSQVQSTNQIIIISFIINYNNNSAGKKQIILSLKPILLIIYIISKRYTTI